MISGIFSVNESKNIVTTASRIHGISAAIGFMALLFFPLLNGILSFKDDEEHIISRILSYVNRETEIWQQGDVQTEQLHFDGFYIDRYKRIVVRGNNEIGLTYTEFEILNLLALHPGVVFSKEQIYDRVWKEPYFGDYNIVMSHIRNIREKIEDNPSKPIYIQTVWGVGYRFNKNLSNSL